VAAVRAEEAKLDLSAVAAAVEAREIVDLKQLDVATLGDPALAVDTIPPSAFVLDLRTADAFAGWHWPGAQRLDYFAALEQWRRLAAGPTYVFYCEVGLKSAHLAELMRAAGHQAFHVQGGVRQLLRQATAEDPALKAALSPALL
jgi:rhodanese-related sulfurtransferase